MSPLIHNAAFKLGMDSGIERGDLEDGIESLKSIAVTLQYHTRLMF